MQVLAQAVRALTEGLKDIPSQGTKREMQSSHGGRLSHELLLSQGPYWPEDVALWGDEASGGVRFRRDTAAKSRPSDWPSTGSVP